MPGPCTPHGGASRCLLPFSTPLSLCGAGASSPLPKPLPQLHFSSGPSLACSPTRTSAPAGRGVLCSHRRDGCRPSRLLLIACVSKALVAVSLQLQRWCCLFSGCSGAMARVPSGRLRGRAGAHCWPHPTVLAPSRRACPSSGALWLRNFSRGLSRRSLPAEGGYPPLGNWSLAAGGQGPQPCSCRAAVPCCAMPRHAVPCWPVVRVPSARTRAGGGVGPPGEEGPGVWERSPAGVFQDHGRSPSQGNSWLCCPGSSGWPRDP